VPYTLLRTWHMNGTGLGCEARPRSRSTLVTLSYPIVCFSRQTQRAKATAAVPLLIFAPLTFREATHSCIATSIMLMTTHCINHLLGPSVGGTTARALPRRGYVLVKASATSLNTLYHSVGASSVLHGSRCECEWCFDGYKPVLSVLAGAEVARICCAQT
jgi:hypothetical protein